MDKEMIKKGVEYILKGLGEDPCRNGLERTPQRVADMYDDVLSGMDADPEASIKVFETQDYDEIILVKDIPLYSICEHHLLPFIGKAHVAYIPKDSMVTGLSNLARVLDIYAKRLQVQERITVQVADTLMKTLNPMGVIVVIEAEHLCMSMRGVKKPGSKAVTSAVRGIFRRNAATRSEVMDLIER